MEPRTASIAAEPRIEVARKGRFQITRLEERIAPKRAATQSVTQVGLVNLNLNLPIALNLLSPGAIAGASVF